MKILMTLSLFLVTSVLQAQPSDSWAEALKKNVRATTLDGVQLTGVDYVQIKSDKSYQAYLRELEKTSLKDLSADEQMALWINAYNALAIKVVVDNWPLEGIREAGGLIFGKVWDRKVGSVGGRVRTLNEIEHQILRKMGDPRIHAAIVCASVSCPDLRTEPFRAATLDAQLDDQMKDFLSNSTKGLQIDRSSRRVAISPIFKWFAEDFKATDQTVLDYVIRYAPDRDRDWLQANRSRLKVTYLDYNWALNRL